MLLLGAVLVVCLAALPRPRPSRAALVAVLLLAGLRGLVAALGDLWADQQELAWDGGQPHRCSTRSCSPSARCGRCAARSAAVLLGAFGLGDRRDRADRAAQGSGRRRRRSSTSTRRASPSRSATPTPTWRCGCWACSRARSWPGGAACPRPCAACSSAPRSCSRGAALLGQSRGWLIALPLVGLVAILAVPGRGRTIVALAAVGAGVALALGPAARRVQRLEAVPAARREPFDAGAERAAAGQRGAGRRSARSRRSRTAACACRRARARRISGAVVAAVAILLLAGGAGYAVVERSPISAAADKWDEFKEGGSSPRTAPGGWRRMSRPTATTTGASPGTSSSGPRCWAREPTTSGAPT